MEELRKNIYLESGFPGVVLGAFIFDKGVLMVDAPFRMEDQRAWRTTLSGLETGKNRMLVTLDSHIDRTMGVRAMEATVIGHEICGEILQKRPASARSQDIDTGADWDPFDLPVNIRWAVPEIAFSQSISIYIGDHPIHLTHHPGAHKAGIWLQDDIEKVLFVGDSVVFHQPPFLACSDIDLWLKDLALIESDAYQGYKVVSGRSGVVRVRYISKLKEFLTDVKKLVAKASGKQAPVEALLEEVPRLLKSININKNLSQPYHNRLAWGLEQYYENHYRKFEEDSKGEN
jgi:glyoxylase-like metal-dependent hydrolase (beta-lactamase superfamily II)